jgi:hypothetical protein
MKILVFLALLSTSFFSQAEGDGNELLEHCQVAVDYFDGDESKSVWKAHACIGYVTGMLDMNQAYDSDEFKHKDKKYFCRPQRASNGQIVRVVLKYLKNNPQNLHATKNYSVIIALKQAFPCNT